MYSESCASIQLTSSEYNAVPAISLELLKKLLQGKVSMSLSIFFDSDALLSLPFNGPSDVGHFIKNFAGSSRQVH